MTHSENISELDILRSIHDGDITAMRTLYDRYVRYLTAICSRYVNNQEDLRDILQDAFLKIYTSLKSFEYRGPGSLKSWMSKIVVNETLKFIRNNSRIEFVELQDDTVGATDREPELNGIPVAAIHEMIRNLPIGYRTIFNLYVFEEKSHKEIAAELDITDSTSASQLHRAKILLSKQIELYRISNNLS